MTKALELAKFGRETPPTGVVVGDSDAQTLSSKTFSDGPVFSGLNANGVPFLNASKVLSSSGTFVFDGTNLGVGVASPSQKLDVYGADNQNAIISRNSGGSTSIRIQSNAAGNYLVGAGNVPVYLQSNSTTAITIDGSQNVGIGATSPADALNIGTGKKFRATHSASVYQQMFSSASGNFLNAYGDNFQINADSGAIYLTTAASQPIVFQTNGTDKLTILGTGNLGLGTAPNVWYSPTNYRVVQVGQSSFVGRITAGAEYTQILSNAYVDIYGAYKYINTGTATNFDMINGEFRWSNKVSGTGGDSFSFDQKMTLKPSGNLGIGTSNPTGKLQIESSGNGLAVGANNFTATASTMVQINASGNSSSENILVLASLNDGARATFRADGNVGIGTSNPASLLHLVSNNADDSGGIRLERASGTTGRYNQYISSTGDLTFTETAVSTRITLQKTTGNVGIGATNPQEKLHVQGKLRVFDGGYPYLDLGVASNNYFRFLHDNPNDRLIIGKNSATAMVVDGSNFVHFYAQGVAGAGTINLTSADPFIRFTGSGTADKKKWDIRAISASGVEALEFRTINDANTVFSTKLWIGHNGFVGIGKTNPGVALDVVGNAQVVTTAAGTYGLIAAGSSGGARDIFLAGQQGFSNGFTVRYDGAAMVYAFQDGNVCIGAITPFGNFGVAGSTNLGNNVASSQAAQYFTRLSGYAARYNASSRYGSYGQLIFHADDGWTSGARRWMITNVLNVSSFGIIRSTSALTDPGLGDGGSVSSGTADFTITNVGYIGIGTDNPTVKLEVNGEIKSAGININQNDNLLYFTKTAGSTGTNSNNTHFIGRVDSAGYHITADAGGFASIVDSFVIGAKGSLILGTSTPTTAYTTGRVIIDQTGNVGIGTRDPTEKLHVRGIAAGNGAQGPRINLQYSGTSGNAESLVRFLDFRGNANAAIGNVLLDDGVNTAAAALVLKTAIGGTLYERMRIDAAGRVTMPYKPAWCLRPNSGGTAEVGNSIVGWTNNTSNTSGKATFLNGVTLTGSGSGIHNATSTGRLTVPVAGKYKIWVTIRGENFPTPGNLYVDVNGSVIARQHVEIWGPNSGYLYAHGFLSMILDLSANDFIEIRVACGGLSVSGYNDTVNWFSGELIG